MSATDSAPTAPQKPKRPVIYNPLDSLTHLCNAVRTLDSVLDSRGQRAIIEPHRRDLVFIRNTLSVCFDIWQDDVLRRINRSRDNIYVYPLTLDQADNLLRRLIPGLAKAARDLKTMDIPSLVHIPNVLANIAHEVRAYTGNSRASLKRALARPAQLDSYNIMEFMPRPLPPVYVTADTDTPQAAPHNKANTKTATSPNRIQNIFPRALAALHMRHT